MTSKQPAVMFNKPGRFWFERHPTSLNWLALGVLLAAWNAADNDASRSTEQRACHERPSNLRGYAPISVRALVRMNALRR